MKKCFIAFIASLAINAAHAAQPVFVANCPTDINVDAGRTGVVYINGQKASVTKLNDNAYEFKADQITISVANNPGRAPDVFFTGKGKAHGVCAVTGFEDGNSAATPAQQQVPYGGAGTATGMIPCAHAKAKRMGQCAFSVEREAPGTAMVRVTRPDGRMRVIFFEKGKAIGADLSQADGDLTFKAAKEADRYKIRAGKERYEIPEAVIFGG